MFCLYRYKIIHDNFLTGFTAEKVFIKMRPVDFKSFVLVIGVLNLNAIIPVTVHYNVVPSRKIVDTFRASTDNLRRVVLDHFDFLLKKCA